MFAVARKGVLRPCADEWWPTAAAGRHGQIKAAVRFAETIRPVSPTQGGNGKSKPDVYRNPSKSDRRELAVQS